jgi:hypothetical protein
MWNDVILSTGEAISLLRQHFTFSEINPVISHASLGLHLGPKRIYLSVYAEKPGTMYHLCLYRKGIDKPVEENFAALNNLVATIQHYVEQSKSADRND